MTDFLAEKRREISDRMVELKPFVDEYSRLHEAVKALGSVGTSTTRSAPAAAIAAPARRKPGRPKGSKTRKSTGTRRGRPTSPKTKTTTATAPRAGRPKGSGARGAEALAFVQGQPGITIPELAAKMSIKQNYLYRVLPGLEQEKKIKKDARGWHPAG